jgi:LuxR family maltose regulon positive regulatory protein
VTVTNVPFDLLEVKLAPPLSRAGTVPRSGVIARLCESGVPFVTVVAPAGYGKTTLLAHWAEIDPRSFGWVALDGRDDDALVFLRYIAVAMHGVEPLPSGVFEALSGSGGATWASRVLSLGAALSAVEAPLVLVLDDLHAVRNPSCLDALTELVSYVPAGSLIAVASREEPPLPLARWRTQGLVQELGVADLRLEVEEAGVLLRAAGVDLQARDVSELTEQTEGWPAGLYLAALSISAGAPGATSAKSFSGDDRFVSDYLRLELLSRLPAAEVEFLTRTSILERLSGGLCDAVLATKGSAQTLETLSHANGFLVRLDRRGEWFRYHHLFGQLLRNELERSEPGLVAALNARAMAWCIAHDLPEEALRYGHAAGQTSTVADLVDALTLPACNDGRIETVEEWLSWFSDGELREHPALAVYGAWVRVLTGRPEEAERWLALADGATSASPVSDGSATIAPWVATLRAHMMVRGVDRALADANLALEQLSSTSGWIPVAFHARGVAHAMLGASERAAEDLAATIQSGLARKRASSAYAAHAQLALIAAGKGSWGEAGRHARAGQALVDETGHGNYASSALPPRGERTHRAP